MYQLVNGLSILQFTSLQLLMVPATTEDLSLIPVCSQNLTNGIDQ
jgi:hypothetical protein